MNVAAVISMLGIGGDSLIVTMLPIIADLA